MRCFLPCRTLTRWLVLMQLQEGEASADKKQAAMERQDKDYTPSSDEAGTPANYDGPATRTRATSDSPPDPYTTEVPEPPSDM